MNQVTSKDGTSIAFERYGDGPPVIAVGGALSTRRAAMPLAMALAPHFTVIGYDRRGRGDSGDTHPYSVEREIEDIDALISEAGGQAFVVGHSSGAVLALRAAAAGLAISKLADFEPPFIVDDSRPPLPADYVEHLNDLIAAGRRGDAVEYFMTAAVGVPQEFVASMRAEPMWSELESVAHTLPYDGAVMGDTMSNKPLSESPWNAITVPTLVIVGGNSEPYMHNGARALANILPASQWRILEGQNHNVDPNALAPVLIEFFLS